MDFSEVDILAEEVIGKDMIAFYNPIKATGWGMATVAYEDELFAPVFTDCGPDRGNPQGYGGSCCGNAAEQQRRTGRREKHHIHGRGIPQDYRYCR